MYEDAMSVQLSLLVWYLFYSLLFVFFFFFKQKTAYEMRISDWSSDVCSSDLSSSCSAAHCTASSGAKPSRSPARSSSLQRSARIPEIGRASCRERVCQYV